jgi:hypothetical protein
MFTKIKQMLDNLESQLEEARRDRDEYKASYRNVSAENERLKAIIAEFDEKPNKGVDVMNTKIQIVHSKITNLPKIGFEDKVIIAENIDEDDKIKVVLWLERSEFKGKDRICLSGAAYNRSSLNNEFVMQKAAVIGYHPINKNGEEMIKGSVEDYDIKSLYKLITN